MKYGLESRHIRFIEETIVKTLREQGAKVWVFGSRVRGDHQKFSDLDLLVEGELPPYTLSHLRELIEESSLPIKVDLVAADELAESYRKSVWADRKLWE